MKTDKTLLVIFSIIFLLIIVSFWQFQRFQELLSKIETPEFKIPKIEFFPKISQKEIKFTTPDGKLTLGKLYGWTEIDKKILENINQEMIKEGSEILFFAQKFDLQKGGVVSLILQEIEDKKNPKELFKLIKQEMKKRGGELEILDLNLREKDFYFDGRYQQAGGIAFRLKERGIVFEDRSYLIVVFTLEKSWPEYEEEINEIFSSIELIY